MNIFRAIGRVFVGIGKGIVSALRFAEARGLTDDLVDLALRHVLRAQEQFDSNEARRRWVLQEIQRTRLVPDSIANIAIELAVQQYKKQVLGQ